MGPNYGPWVNINGGEAMIRHMNFTAAVDDLPVCRQLNVSTGVQYLPSIVGVAVEVPNRVLKHIIFNE